MKLHQLQALVAIADCGSIRGAARRLGLSQAALTKAVRELEAQQQLPLLIRHVSGVTFTEFGAALLIHARLVVGQLERAEAELSLLRGHAEGRLSVGVTPFIELTFLPAVVRRFRAKMPHVRLELFEGLSAVSLPRLRNGELDFVVAPHIPSMPAQEFECEDLLLYQNVVIARQGHPLENSSSLHQLLEADWVVNYSPTSYEPFMHNLFWQHGAQIDEQRLVRAHSLTLLLSLVRHADMFSYCPEPLLVAEPMLEWIRVMTLEQQFETGKLGIISRRDTTRSVAAKCFVDCLIQEIRRCARSASAADCRLSEKLTLLI